MNRLLPKIFPFLILLSLIAIFFNKTLTGKQFFVTPDFGLSDILMGEYPQKYFLSQSLKNHQLPLWNSQIGTGFPEFATISGFFNPLNLILFYFLSPPIAFNLALATAFLVTGAFTFLYCRALKLSQFSSLLAAISFTFSGILITQIVHLSVIQTLSFFPIELFLVETFIQKKKLVLCILFSFALGIQILTGFFQIVLYSLIVLAIYALLRIFYHPPNSQDRYRQLTVLALATVAGLLIGAVQLLPSWQFSQLSYRAQGVSEEIKLFPYPPKHLITFLWPYLLGDPRLGTYPNFSQNWGIFWESTGYIGILPLVFAFWAVLFVRNKNKLSRIFLIISVFSLLLMLGKSLPTFFLFKLPPLSLFRVPARWIIFLTFSLCILAAIGFDSASKKLETLITAKKFRIILPSVILAVTTVNLFLFAYNYNLRGQTDKWLALTQTASYLKNDSSLFRVDSANNVRIWNEQFTKKGWLSQPDNYLPLLEVLTPNFNVIQGINHVGSYPIIQTKRALQVNYFRNQDIKPSEKGLTIGSVARKLLDSQNVKYLITPFNLLGRDLELVSKTQTQPSYYIYENTTVFPRAFIATTWQLTTTLEAQYQLLASGNFDPQKTVILEKDPRREPFKSKILIAKISKYDNKNVEIEAQTDNGGILVLADAFYPGWEATVDGSQTEILAANINQRAVILEKGKHTVKFTFRPLSFRIGLIISLSTAIFLLILLTLLYLKTAKKNKNRGPSTQS